MTSSSKCKQNKHKHPLIM